MWCGVELKLPRWLIAMLCTQSTVMGSGLTPLCVAILEGNSALPGHQGETQALLAVTPGLCLLLTLLAPCGVSPAKKMEQPPQPHFHFPAQGLTFVQSQGCFGNPLPHVVRINKNRGGGLPKEKRASRLPLW